VKTLTTYYPFGLRHTGYNTTKKTVKYKETNNTKKEVKQVLPDEVKFKYKYNFKEYQDELGLNWYDYGARNYDAALGRFMNLDPLTEKYNTHSPYVYANNNPVLFKDINGMGIDEIDEKDWMPVVKRKGNVYYIAEKGNMFGKLEYLHQLRFNVYNTFGKEPKPENLMPQGYIPIFYNMPRLNKKIKLNNSLKQ